VSGLRVLVTHPGRQHSHQAALALQKAGLLAGYWAGVPSLEEHGRLVPLALWRRLIPYAPVPLDPSRVRWAPWAPSLRRIGDRLPGGAAREIDLAACRLFDRWAARRLPRAQTSGQISAVIACEISALSTFRAARARGITTLLDAPSIHWAVQDRLHGTLDPPDLHRRIVRIKEEEIARADHILTVSELARQTYLEVGIPAEKVHAVPLGADLSLFRPDGTEEAPRDGFVFLFAGASIHRKGFDLLLVAFARVAAEMPDARLRVVGPRGDSAHLLESYSALPIEATGPTDQRGLAAEFRRADCLVLPSRNDSYAMVVTEALAAGLPAIVSEMVGAKDLIREGKNGWIVPAGEAKPLAERMLACARDRETLRAMRGECRRSAEAATWEAYHERFAELMRRIVP
jgi:glycosyltransferase involved in cell wall biosynthesis